MIEVSQIQKCKQLRCKGTAIRKISRELLISRNTVRKYLRGEEPPGTYQFRASRKQPAQEVIEERVRTLLTAEQAAHTPRKQRLTASRIYRLLRDSEGGCSVSEVTVRRVVRWLRRELEDKLARAYLPLSYLPGEDAQVDFLTAVADENGVRVKVFLLLVRACFSGRTYAYAAPNQTREALLEGLTRAFEHFGGVPQTIWFDNLTPAVKKVLRGRNREQQRGFEVFTAHYGFKAEFCGPGKGNEKGGVENAVKYCEHEILSPVPQIANREELQTHCDAFMTKEDNRTASRREATIGDLWKAEVAELLPLPSSRFDAGMISTGKVTNRSWVQLGTNFYSVPVELVGEEVTIKTSAEEIRIFHRRSGLVATHKRMYGRDGMSLHLAHYLPLLHRKCRGLDRAIPMRMWMAKSAPCWSTLLVELRRREGEVDGSRAFVDVLQLCAHHGEDPVTAAVKKALRHELVSIAAIRFHLASTRELAESRPAPFVYPGPSVITTTSAAYGALCATSSQRDASHG